MRNLLLTILTLSCLSIYGQKEPYNYIIKEPIVVYGYNLKKEVSEPDNIKIATPNQEFRQIGDEKTDSSLGQVYIIQFLKIKGDSNQIKSDPIKINSSESYKFFCIKASNYKEPAIRKKYKTWFSNAKPNFGTLVVPIKMRCAQSGIPFDFTTDFTLGSSFGYSFRMSHYQPNYLSLVGVFGVTSVGADSLTTKGYITEPNTKLSAITPGIGIVAEINNFQIGFIIGWDIVGGTTGKNWIYNGKTWFSFGIGYQFLSKGEKN